MCSSMWTTLCISVLFLATTVDVFGTDKIELGERRQRGAAAFHDGILLVHAKSVGDAAADGFRQDAAFYYFTGLENTSGALLAIDGRTGGSLLFLPAHPPYYNRVEPEG